MISHSRLNIAKDEIKARLGIQQVIEYVTGQTFVRGAIRCPFHNEKDGSFRVNGSYYKCFGCGESGDIFNFVMKYQGLAFKDSIAWLDSTFHLGLLGQKISVTQQITERKRKKEQEKQQHEETRKHQELLEIADDYRVCHMASLVLEPFSDEWCYCINRMTCLDYLMKEGGY